MLSREAVMEGIHHKPHTINYFLNLLILVFKLGCSGIGLEVLRRLEDEVMCE